MANFSRPNFSLPAFLSIRRENCDFHRRQFAANRIMLNSIRTGFTFRFREW
jgi:hypothetical protein